MDCTTVLGSLMAVLWPAWVLGFDYHSTSHSAGGHNGYWEWSIVDGRCGLCISLRVENFAGQWPICAVVLYVQYHILARRHHSTLQQPSLHLHTSCDPLDRGEEAVGPHNSIHTRAWCGSTIHLILWETSVASKFPSGRVALAAPTM